MNGIDFEVDTLLRRAIGPVLGLVVLAVVGGIAYHFYNKSHDAKLEKAAGELFVLQKELGAVAQRLAPEQPIADPLKPVKNPTPKASPEEMEKGFSPIVEKLQAFVAANQGTQPAVEAALLVNEATNEYQKYDQGIKALETATKDFSKKNFLYGIAMSELGVQYAKTDKCNEATQAWDKVIAVKEHEYMADQLRLKSGVCFQTLGMYDKAEKLYEDVIKKGSESSNGRMAKKFLLYIKYVKAKAAKENTQENNSEKS